jgi:hypothetical protein
MASKESHSWYTLRGEVFVACVTVDKGADAMVRNRSSKFYRIYRGGARLEIFSPAGGYPATYNVEKAKRMGHTIVGRFSNAHFRSGYHRWNLAARAPKCAAAVTLRTPEPLQVEGE